MFITPLFRAFENETGGHFFLDVPGGTSTFVINILVKLRQRKHITIVGASSAIAETPLSGDHTAHSCFKIPLDLSQKEKRLIATSVVVL